VVDVLGVNRFDETNVVGDFRRVREEFTQPGTTLAVLLESIFGSTNRVSRAGGHSSQTELRFDQVFAVADGEHLLLVMLVQQWLVIIENLLGRAAGQE